MSSILPNNQLGYKIFNKNWKCRDVQYKVGETQIQKGKVKLCENGLHFCPRALDCLSYYSLTQENKYAEVEVPEGSEIDSDKTKCATNKLKIIKELSFEEFSKLCSGVRETWYDNGQIQLRCNYKDGELNGLCESWYENGQPFESRNYKNGEREGICESW